MDRSTPDGVRTDVDLPLLRKDFIVSEYQLLEAKAAGADAVLLIVAALRPAELKVLHDHARRHGLDVLVEVHNATELSIAVDAGARIIGVNNRNLRTLAVDVHASDELIAQIPTEAIAVSESGLRTPDDLRRLRGARVSGFLIGEAVHDGRRARPRGVTREPNWTTQIRKMNVDESRLVNL
jgi:indole-3-glycerol phosphate synthase